MELNNLTASTPPQKMSENESTPKSVIKAILQALGVACVFAVLALIANGIIPGYFAKFIGGVSRSEFEDYQKVVESKLGALNAEVSYLKATAVRNEGVVLLRNVDADKTLFDVKEGDNVRLGPNGAYRTAQWQVLLLKN